MGTNPSLARKGPGDAKRSVGDAKSSLGDASAAADEMRALGDLDAPKYGDHGHSAVPFALRYLAAELPFRLSQPQVSAHG